MEIGLIIGVISISSLVGFITWMNTVAYYERKIDKLKMKHGITDIE